MFLSGAATTASRLGQPDLAIATLNDFVQSAQMVCSLDPQVPVIADADTGYAIIVLTCATGINIMIVLVDPLWLRAL